MTMLPKATEPSACALGNSFKRSAAAISGLTLVVVLCGSQLPAASPGGEGGLGYRGPGRSCIVPDADPPVAFDMATGQNILWRAGLANWGHGMPTVAGGRAYVMSEPGWKHDWPLLQCLDADTGKELWSAEINPLPVTTPDASRRAELAQKMAAFHAYYRDVYKAVFLWNQATDASRDEARKLLAVHGLKLGDDDQPWREYAAIFLKKGSETGKGNAEVIKRLDAGWKPLLEETGFRPETWRHTLTGGLMCVGHAFPAPVSDGQRVWVATASGTFACFDRDGKLIWMRSSPGTAGEFCRNGRSPILYKNLLLSDVTAVMRAMDRDTGELKWSAKVDDETIMTPAIITVDGVDVVLCYNKRAFRLPDGEPLEVKGSSDFGHTTLVDPDNRNVTYSFGIGEHCGWTNKGHGEILSPAAVRWRLEGDTLLGTVLWHGIEEMAVGPHAVVVHAGRLYVGGMIVEAATGKVLAGKPGRRGGALTPPSRHMLWIAGGRLYGLEMNGKVEVRSLDGKLLGQGQVLPAPVEGDKREQIICQDSPRLRDLKVAAWQNVAYGGEFLIAGDRIYVRTADELVCIGKKP